MALGRTALRITTIEALRPSNKPDDAPWPTMAEGDVRDAPLDAVADYPGAAARPTAIVYVDEDDGVPGQNRETAGGPPFRRTMRLTIELAVVEWRESTETPATYEPHLPVSDPELEASLDLFEAQVRWALFYGATGGLWRTLTKNRVVRINSVPNRTGEEAIRLAARTLSLDVVMPDDCFDPIALVDPVGFDRLPEPFRTVAKALPASSYGFGIATGLADRAPVPPVLPRLEGVAAGIDLSPPREGRIDVEVSIVPPQD